MLAKENELYYHEALKIQGIILWPQFEFNFIPSFLHVDIPLSSQGYTLAILLSILTFILQ
jgi:hypothetical protein